MSLFDPKLYKHVHSDKHTTTLKHKKGHELRIAHNVISPKMRASLEALSKIGEENQTEGQRQEAQDQNQYGKVIQKANGGKVDPKFAAITEKQRAIAQKRHPEPSAEDKAKQAHRHKTQDEFMRNTAGKPMRREYAEGGKAPIPDSTTESSTSTRQRNLRDASNVEKTSTNNSQAATASDPSKIWSNITNGWAEGGHVSEPSPEELGGLPAWFHTAGEQTHASHPQGTTGGGPDSYAYDAGLPCLNPHCKSHGQPHPNCKCYTGGEGYANGGEVSASKLRYCAHGKPHKPECHYSEQGRDVRHGNGATNPKDKAMSQHFAREEAIGRAQEERMVKPKMKGFAHGGPADESDTENELDQFDKAHPSRLEQSNNERQGLPAFMQQPSSSPSPMMKPGMPGYDEPHTPINDTEDPAMQDNDGGRTNQAMYNKIHGQPDNFGQSAQSQDPNSLDSELDQAAAPQDELNQPPVQGNMTGQPQQGQPQQPQQPIDHVTQLTAHMLDERSKWEQDIANGHITPKTYHDLMYHNKDGSEKSTLGKIGSILGVMISGFGAGMAHQPNMALQMMDQTIKNDLEAQKTSKENSQNYLRVEQQRLLNDANVQQVLQSADRTQAEKQQIMQGIEKAAYANSYLKMGSAAVAKANELIQKYPEGSPERQKAAQVAMMVAQANETNGAKAAAIQAAGINGLSMYGSDPSQQASSTADQAEHKFQDDMQARENMGDKAGADSMRSRHITGVPGFAKDSTNVPRLQETVENANILSQKIKEIQKMAKENYGTLDPSKLKLAAQKAHELTQMYNASTDSLGMTKGRMDWLDTQIKKNPTSPWQQILGNNAALQEIMDSSTQKTNSRLHDNGFSVQPTNVHYSQQNGQSKQQDQDISTDKKTGKQYKSQMINGKQYYVPVK